MASFRKRGDTWEYRIRYTDRQTGKFKEKSKGGFRTKKEAQLAANEEESKINQYGFAENGDEIVSRYFDDWLEVYKKPNVKPITHVLGAREKRQAQYSPSVGKIPFERHNQDRVPEVDQ